MSYRVWRLFDVGCLALSVPFFLASGLLLGVSGGGAMLTRLIPVQGGPLAWIVDGASFVLTLPFEIAGNIASVPVLGAGILANAFYPERMDESYAMKAAEVLTVLSAEWLAFQGGADGRGVLP